MSVKTSVSSTAQSLSTPPRNVVRTRSFACIDPAEGSPHAVRGQCHHLALLISSSKGSVPSLQKSVDLPCQPRLLVGPDSDSLCDRYIINTLGDVGSGQSLCTLGGPVVLLYVAACLNIFQSWCQNSLEVPLMTLPATLVSVCELVLMTLTSGLYAGISMTVMWSEAPRWGKGRAL